MSLAESLVRTYFASSNMVAVLRFEGAPVDVPVPVRWVLDGSVASFEHTFTPATYVRVDEAVVLDGSEVVDRIVEARELTLPPGSEYRATFTVTLVEV